MFEDLLTQLQALPPGPKGKAFERLVAWYLRHAPRYRSHVNQVHAWDRWDGRWGADAGIDLIVETHAGELWAVQAKAYTPGYSIKKADVDSFLSESSRAVFTWRLLVATTDALGRTAARTIHDQEKGVGLQLLSQLRHEEVEWPASLDELSPPATKRMAPLMHQTEAIQGVIGGFAKNRRGQLIMACGTGKTLTSLWIDEALGNRQTLVIVPSLSLLGQTLRSWTANATTRLDYLAVCSDETVASADSFTTRTADLGVPVTTDPATIRSFLSCASGRQVLFCTYHSSPAIAEAQDGTGNELDLVVVDEAHRAAGQATKVFGTVLDEDRIRARKRLFMTATPRFVSSGLQKAAQARDYELTSMDDPAIFGPVLHRLPFPEAIDRELLSDYRVVVIGVNDKNLARLVERRELFALGDETVDAETLARLVGLLRAIQRFDLRRVLSFHSRIEAARSFAALVPKVTAWMPSDDRPQGHCWTHHITGTMNAGERELLLDQLRHLNGADWGVLSNVRCVAEGVDVPAIDGVAFIDPRRSPIEVIQAVGRAIRKTDDKRVGTIVVPVFIPPGGSEEESLAASDFQAVWSVIRALRAHDEILAEQLDNARFELGRRRGGEVVLPDRIVLDLPVSISPSFARAFTARLVEKSASPFEHWLGLLANYIDIHGSLATLSRTYVVDGHEVGGWVQTQRQNYSNGLLSQKRIERLEALPGWVWDKQEAKFEEMYALLQRFAEREGHALVPQPHLEEGQPLGEWVSTQRRAYTGTRIYRLSKARIRRLESVSGWSWDGQAAKWERGFAALAAYIEREGPGPLPRGYREDGVIVKNWADRQRATHLAGKLPPDRAARLEALPGWRWREGLEAQWERSYAALLAYVEREGHARVPQGHHEQGVKLGQWVATQRHFHKNDRMRADRAERLQRVPGWAWSLS